MRSAEDPEHMAALNRLHDAATTKADWELFKSRSCHAGNPAFGAKGAADFLRDALHLYSTNAESDTWNNLMVKKLGNPIAKFRAISTGKDKLIREHPTKAGGMPRDLLLAVRARVMLRRNMWLSRGLVNGSLGYVHAIVFDPETKNKGDGVLPLGVICVFDKYTGPPFLADVPNSVWVPVFTARWEVKGNHYSRTMLPLILGWAITIHKSQGMTIGKGSAIA
jgi:ATP-dependent DNA helicase PIF1